MTALDRRDPLARALVRFLRDQDDSAMAEIVRETRPRLLAAARRIGNGQDAEDSVQTAYLSLVRHRGGAMDVPVFPWLLTATLRIAYRHKAVHRREEHIAGMLAREATWDRGRIADAMPAEEAAIVRREVGRLPARYRDVVVLHYLQGLSTAETALLLDVPDATVRKRLERARGLLRAGGLARLLPLVAAAAWLGDRVALRPGVVHGALFAGGVMKTSTAVVGIVVAAIVGLGAGTLASRRGDDEAKTAAQADTVAGLRRELEATRTELRATEQRAARAPRTRTADAAATTTVAPAPDEARTAPPPANTTSHAKPGVASGRYDEVLGRVDWTAVGEHYHAMLASLAAAAHAMETGAPADPRTDQQIEEHAMAVLNALAAFSEQVPGGGISKVFTHPAFLANALAAALAKTSTPLTDDEVAAIGRLCLGYLTDDTTRLAHYDAATFELRKVVDEGALRASFIASALAVLTPDQRDVVSPPGLRDRLDGDFVSTAFFWRDRAAPLRFIDVASFTEGVVRDLTKSLALRDDQAPALHTAVERWTATLPPAWFDGPDDVLAVRGKTRTSVTADLARRETDLLESLPNALALDAAQTAKARAFAGTWRMLRGAK